MTFYLLKSGCLILCCYKMSLTWSCLNFAMIDDKINARDQKGGLLKGSFIALY